jgi:hypothetical protein
MAVLMGRRKNRVRAAYVSILWGNEREFFHITPKGDLVIKPAFVRKIPEKEVSLEESAEDLVTEIVTPYEDWEDWMNFFG